MRRMRKWPQRVVALSVVAGLVILVSTASAQAPGPSGQVAFGQSTVEPAVDDANGSTVFLLTPNKVPFPSVSNPVASAPMYIPMYPAQSKINPATLNCQPHNCDHLNVLPFLPPGYLPGDSTCSQFGVTGSCGLVIGHDHLIGVPHTGDFNVAWHVILVVFTPTAFTDGAIDKRLRTLGDLATLVMNGDAFEVSTSITFNCSIVPETVYLKGVPLTF